MTPFCHMQISKNIRLWPILLKKSALVSTAEKYASEIEIFTFWLRLPGSGLT